MKAQKIIELEQPKEQFNKRVRPQFKQGLKIASTVLNLSEDSTLEIAIAALLGVETPTTKGQREKIAAVWKTMETPLPFNSLLTPFSNNALTVETDSDTIPALEADGVVAQLVEHHNGIASPGRSSHDGMNAAHLPDNVLPLTPELIHAASLSRPSTHQKPTDSTAGKTSATGRGVFKSANATAAA